MRAISLLAAVIMAAPLLAQNPRASFNVDGASAGPIFDPTVATGGDLSAVAWSDNNQVLISLSDGRGINWSAPVRLDADTSAARKDLQPDSITISGSNIYVVWEDRRFATTTESELLFVRSTDGGATWSAESLIDKGTGAGIGTIRDWRVAVSPDAGGDHIYVLLTNDPTAGSDEELYLTSSHDGGATFGAAVYVPSLAPQLGDVDQIGLAVDGLDVHVAWADDRAGSFSNDDCFYQRSTDGGATFMAADVQLDSSGPLVGDVDDADFGTDFLGCSVDAGVVVVTWEEELTDPSNEELRMAVSADNGTTWVADVLVGGYTAGTNDVDNHILAQSGGNIMAAWEDNRTGSDEIYVGVSSDGGVTFTETPLSAGGGGFPRLGRTAEQGPMDVMAIGWGGGGFPENTYVAFSRDSGATWDTAIIVSDTPGDTDFAEISYNQLYNNCVSAWLSDDLGSNNVYAGGVRPQSLTLNGTIAAGNNINFDVSGFPVAEGGDVFRVLLSGTAGSLSLPGDSRNTGLGFDSILNQSKGKPTLMGVLDPNGAGSTPISVVPPASKLPVGTNLLILAVSKSGGVFGSITDLLAETVL